VNAQQHANPQFIEADIPDTEVISVSAPAPVFVDSTGRRSRLLRRLAYAFGVLVMMYGGLISVSLAGGPVRSSAVLPLPGLADPPKEPKHPPQHVPTPVPTPTPTTRPKALLVTEALPRRTTTPPKPRAVAPRLESTKVAPSRARPKASKSPSKTPTPKPTTTRPTESTTTPPTTTPTTPGNGGGESSAPAPVPPPAPANSGGGGGGSGDKPEEPVTESTTTTPSSTPAEARP
jgi:hypothetical protein